MEAELTGHNQGSKKAFSQKGKNHRVTENKETTPESVVLFELAYAMFDPPIVIFSY